MSNIQNVRIGPASLTLNGTDLGNTLGGLKLTFTRKMTDLKVDRYGDSLIDEALTSTDLKIAGKVAEPVVAVIQKTLPEGAYNVGGAGTQLGFAAGEGASMRAYALPLVIHPLSKLASDQSEDITIYLAVPTASPVVNYEVSNQRVFDLEFTALVSESYTAGRRLGHMGPTNIS